jgi:glyoxylate carboligase
VGWASRVDRWFGKEAFPVDVCQVGDAAVGERAELLVEGFAEKFWINHGKKGAFGWSI